MISFCGRPISHGGVPSYAELKKPMIFPHPKISYVKMK
jgi:hypothetical protein